MSPEHTDFLVTTFPTLYRNFHLDKRDSLMAWGFGVGDGWFGLLSELSEKLEAFNTDGTCRVEAAQVKNKFGSLRYYVDGGNQEVWNIINSYEAKSTTICEDCGAPGECSGFKVLCDSCENSLTS